jgi:hypothetical protein
MGTADSSSSLDAGRLRAFRRQHQQQQQIEVSSLLGSLHCIALYEKHST